MSTRQAKLAVESRAYPLFRYDPDAGKKPEECFDLEGNPAPDEDWPAYTIQYEESGVRKEMELPMTFADFAITEIRFRKHFRVAPVDTWNENMVPLAEFLDLEEDDREGKFPFLWSVNEKQQLSRLLVAKPMVESCEDRRDFWTMLRALAGLDKASREEIATEVRGEIAGKIASGLMQLAGGDGAGVAALTGAAPAPTGEAGAAVGDYMAPWIETDQCTACDECIDLNSRIFAYNQSKKAYIKDPTAGPYKDLVKSAERCTARVIHPGLPGDRSAKDIEKWIKRGEKYN
jgi:pyruvate-ferredoxin/flavodoxin oxidoreductase